MILNIYLLGYLSLLNPIKSVNNSKITGAAMQIYITMTGPSDWAILNSLWAVVRLRDYIPDRIYILTIKKRREQAEMAKRRFANLLREYNKRPQIKIIQVKEADFVGTGRHINKVVCDEKAQGNTVAIEITPGRKALVAGALVPGIQGHADHVFYLYLDDFDYANNLFLRIPLTKQHSHDFMEEIKRA